MKKIITYVLIGLAGAAAAVLAIMLLSKGSALHKAIFGEKVKKDIEADFLRPATLEEAISTAESYGLKHENQNEYYCVFDAEAFGDKTEFLYQCDQNDDVQLTIAFIILNEKSEDGTRLPLNAEKTKERIERVFSELEEAYNIKIGKEFYIFEGESQLNNEDIQSYQRIIDGEAHIEFLMRDAERHYIKVSYVKMTDEADVEVGMIMIEKYFNGEQFEESIPNVVVTNEQNEQ